MPPFYHPLLARVFQACERFLSLLVPRLGSLMCIEVEKQIYAAMRQTRKKGALRIGVQPIAATAIPNARDAKN